MSISMDLLLFKFLLVCRVVFKIIRGIDSRMIGMKRKCGYSPTSDQKNEMRIIYTTTTYLDIILPFSVVGGSSMPDVPPFSYCLLLIYFSNILIQNFQSQNFRQLFYTPYSIYYVYVSIIKIIESEAKSCSTPAVENLFICVKIGF